VDDVVAVNLHFMQQPVTGIYNVGSGRAQAFNDVALTVVNTLRAADGLPALTLAQAVESGLIEYVPFPEALRGKYQAFTEADLTRLRAAGFDGAMQPVESGTASYVRWRIAQGE
jgi:ADP-L-glycero-D-manno-heptose 6-epimerase